MIINTSKRKIGYTYGSVSGSFPFRREKSIEFESILERDMLKILEYDSHVVDVIEQPMTIPYTNHNGRDVTYTPDFLVHYDNKKSCLMEVKPYKKLVENWNKLRPRLKIGFRHARDEGWVFHIYHDLKIRGDHLNRIQFLARYKNIGVNHDETFRIVEYLKTVNYILINKLIENLYPGNNKQEALTHIWHLISTHVIWCDLTQELDSKTTVVWLNHFAG